MANNYTLRILTPDRVMYEGEASRTLITTAMGGLDFYAGHAPIVVITVPGKTAFYDASGTEKILFTSEGVASFEDNELTFCCDSAEWPEEIDVARAEKAKERAEARLGDGSNFDKERAEMSLQRAIIRLSLKH